MSDLRLAGRVAIVSGGAHRLGRAMVMALSARSAVVLVPDINEENLSTLTGETQDNVIGELAVVSVESDVQRVVQRCTDLFGHVDVVVNNAGITSGALGRDREADPLHFWDLTRDEFDRFLAVHTLGPFLLTKAALSQMVEGGWGPIVTVTTSHTTMLGSGRAPYGAAKAASEALASVMAHELVGTGVAVIVLILGGSVATYPDRQQHAARQLIEPSVMGPPPPMTLTACQRGASSRSGGTSPDPTQKISSTRARRLRGHPNH